MRPDQLALELKATTKFSQSILQKPRSLRDGEAGN